jgi:diguanylate cyclase (GGDEF)-like protein/PAS domain S-box-containing protein
MRFPAIRLTTATRISIGLVALAASLFVMFDGLFGLTPNDIEVARMLRQHAAESVAAQAAAYLETHNEVGLHNVLDRATQGENRILSAAMRRTDGEIVAQAGNHAEQWSPRADGRSTLTHVRVPILAGNRLWGHAELSFEPTGFESAWSWLMRPRLLLSAALILMLLFAFYLYLRRVLMHLDPAKAIPERVRAAFDTLTEGVVVLDTRERIVMANAAFRSWHGSGDLYGREVTALEWVKSALSEDRQMYPWREAMRQEDPVRGRAVEILRAGAEPVKTIMSCSRIQDGHGATRGCLVTFNDVTELDRSNQQLRDALSRLNDSRKRISKQNDELRRLASRDPLTNCLNRRAFFEALEPLIASAQAGGMSISCIMSDIDHFKSFNDRYGHTVGDQVIQAVAGILTGGIRSRDLLCRYGGEEFCTVLPGASAEDAVAVAEELRAAIESEAGGRVDGAQNVRVTSSFGVATLTADTRDIQELIDRADAALYDAKKAGRNRVMRK